MPEIDDEDLTLPAEHPFNVRARSLKTPDPLLKPSGANCTAGSLTAVEQQEIALRLRHAHLSDALPGLKAAEALAIEQRRTAVAEMAVIVRLLKAHERLKAPRKRR